ncbi:MAG: hypothetical protein LBH09_05360, partial [Peptococcaceae bacterium]|nr:hypothetical protein [Peptococcaceae bacterium]
MDTDVITNLQSYLQNQSEFSFIIQQTGERRYNLIHGVTGGQRGFLCAAIAQNLRKDVLFAAENSQKAEEMIDDLSFWLPGHQVLFFPALDILSFEVFAQSKETRWKRLEVLQALLFPNGPVAVVTTVEALRKTMLPREQLLEQFRILSVGDAVDVMELVGWLIERGYERVERVEEKGQLALRGGILDVYSPAALKPWRLEFFDDEVDSIRAFSADSQRSTDKMKTILLAPASECVFSTEQRVSVAANLQAEKKDLERRSRRRSAGRGVRSSVLDRDGGVRSSVTGGVAISDAVDGEAASDGAVDSSVAGGGVAVSSAVSGSVEQNGSQPGDRADQLTEMIRENPFFPGHELLLPYAGVNLCLITDYFEHSVLPVMAEPSR